MNGTSRLLFFIPVLEVDMTVELSTMGSNRGLRTGLDREGLLEACLIESTVGVSSTIIVSLSPALNHRSLHSSRVKSPAGVFRTTRPLESCAAECTDSIGS